MVFRGSEKVELKEIVVNDIRKEIIAFANCNGGKLYIGVQDDGTGMRKIIRAYKNQEAQPVIESTKNAFKIILPNINMESEEKKILSEQITLNKQLEEKTEKLQNRESEILEYIKMNGDIIRADAEELLGISASTTLRILKKMVEDGILLKQGKARNAKYILNS